MSPEPGEYLCTNHPDARTGSTCSACGRPFCDNCLTEIRGRRTCGWCRDTELYRMQPRGTVDAAQVVKWARIYDAGVAFLGAGCSLLCGGFYSYPFWLRSAASSAGSSVGTTEATIMIVIFAVITLITLAAYLPPAIALVPGRGWMWIWQLIALILGILGGFGSFLMAGIAGAMVVVPSIILLVYWIKPEVRSYVEQG